VRHLFWQLVEGDIAEEGDLPLKLTRGQNVLPGRGRPLLLPERRRLCPRKRVRDLPVPGGSHSSGEASIREAAFIPGRMVFFLVGVDGASRGVHAANSWRKVGPR